MLALLQARGVVMSNWDTMWANFPPATESKSTIFNALGAGWPALIGDENYDNTCTIRFSMALNRSGFKVLESDSSAKMKDKDGNFIAIRVPEAEKIAKRIFGESYWGMSHNPGSPLDLAGLPSQKGLLIYRVDSGVYGHVDLWDGGICRVNCHSNFATKCHSIQLWKLD